MAMNTKQPTELDSTCSRRVVESDAPSAVAPRCQADATTWVVSPKGTRRYVCADHAAEVLRFRDADADTSVLPDHPTVRPCSVCGKYTLPADMDLATGTCGDCRPAGDDDRTDEGGGSGVETGSAEGRG